MKKLYKKIPSELRDIFTLVVGNGFALFVPVIVSPIISRMYDATDFGVFTIYLAMLSLISSFATGRYDFAILITKSRYNAQHLFKVAMLLTIGVAMVVMLITLVFWKEILQIFNIPSMGAYLFLVPINILLFAVIKASQNGLNREKEYSPISVSKTIRSVLVGGFQVILGAMGFLSGGLIIGKLSGDLFSSGYLLRKLNKVDNYLTSSFSLKRASYLMKKYEKFLKVNAPHAFVNALSLSVIPILLSYFFNEKTVGYYGLAYMVCIVPVQLIASAFYQVFSQKVSEMYNDKISLRGYTKKTLKQLFMLAVIPFGILTFFGPEIFQFVFGVEWLVSGELVQLLAPFLFVVFLISPVTYIPLIYNEHNKSFYFEIALFIIRVVAIIVGANMGGIYLAIGLFSGVSILIQVINLIWIISLTKKYKIE